MPELTLLLNAFSVRSAKPSQKYGLTNPLPASTGEAVMLRLPLGKIPRDATIISASLELTTAADFAASVSLNVARNTDEWDSSVTWNTRGGTADAGTAITKASGDRSTVWSFDVTSIVQDIVSRVVPNHGARVYRSAGDSVRLRGTTASSNKPRLVVTYTLAPPAPTSLRPSSGAVGVAKPVLRFDAADDITAAQVQIDGPPGDSTPEWSSGTYATVGGQVRLALTDYPGLSDGDSKVWRVRQRNDHGWSAWSSWATLVRLDKGTSTLLNPPALVEDVTPPFEWTAVSSGAQVAWRARLLDASGKALADSGVTPGTATSWTPPTGFTVDGQTGTAEVTIWDDADRESGPGDPVTIKLTQALTFNLDPTVDPMDSLSATSVHPFPDVLLQGARALGTPDEVVVFRDGKRIARLDGVAVFAGGTFRWRDRTATMGERHVYRVAPVVGGKIAKGGPTATITPTCQGVWIEDEASRAVRAVILGMGGPPSVEETTPEQSVLHVPISSDDEAEVVRRRMLRLPLQGSVSGVLVSFAETDALDSEAVLREFAENDAGHVYRLIYGRRALLVRAGDFEFFEQPEDSPGDRVLGVSFNWWALAKQAA